MDVFGFAPAVAGRVAGSFAAGLGAVFGRAVGAIMLEVVEAGREHIDGRQWVMIRRQKHPTKKKHPKNKIPQKGQENP